MTKKDVVIFLVCVVFCSGFSWYSYQGYEKVVQAGAFQQTTEPAIPLIQNGLESITVESLNRTVEKTEFSKALQRNICFPRLSVAPVVAPPPVVINVPKIEPEPIETVPEKEEDVFVYRGKVVVNDELKYVVERVRDKKTYFVIRGESTREFTVIETTDKQVIITDAQDAIKVLTLVK